MSCLRAIHCQVEVGRAKVMRRQARGAVSDFEYWLRNLRQSEDTETLCPLSKAGYYLVWLLIAAVQ